MTQESKLKPVSEFANRLGLEIARGMAEALEANPAPGREFDPDSWTASGGCVDFGVVAQKRLLPIIEQSQADKIARLEALVDMIDGMPHHTSDDYWQVTVDRYEKILSAIEQYKEQE